MVPEDWRHPPASLSVTARKAGRPDMTFPAAGSVLVGIDPRRGRLALPDGITANSVEVAYAYGFPGDIGAGPYDRRPGSGFGDNDSDPLAALPDPTDFEVVIQIPSAASCPSPNSRFTATVRPISWSLTKLTSPIPP